MPEQTDKLDRFEEWDGYGEPAERGGGGGKHTQKGPTKSQEVSSAEENARLARERQIDSEDQIQSYIDKTWGNLPPEKKEQKIADYAKWMEKNYRKKDFKLDPTDKREVLIESKLSGGSGGQNVQKNMTSIRVKHFPTGLRVNSESEKSQFSNKQTALRILTLNIKSQLGLWKETSKEFRQKLMRSKETKIENVEFATLPENVNPSIEKNTGSTSERDLRYLRYEKLKRAAGDFRDQKLDETFGAVEELLEIKNIQKGSRAAEIVLGQAYQIIELSSIEHINADKDENLEPILEDSILMYMEHLKEVVEKRPQELKDLNIDSNSMVIHFDTLTIDPDDPNGTLLILTTYIPHRGWSVMVPADICPNWAANTILEYVRERPDEHDDSVFSNSIKELVAASKLEFLNNGQTIIFKDVSSLNFTQSVFHGKGFTFSQAMETLRGAADPIDNVFNYIIYKDDSEFEYLTMPPMTLDF